MLDLKPAVLNVGVKRLFFLPLRRCEQVQWWCRSPPALGLSEAEPQWQTHSGLNTSLSHCEQPQGHCALTSSLALHSAASCPPTQHKAPDLLNGRVIWLVRARTWPHLLRKTSCVCVCVRVGCMLTIKLQQVILLSRRVMARLEWRRVPHAPRGVRQQLSPVRAHTGGDMLLRKCDQGAGGVPARPQRRGEDPVGQGRAGRGQRLPWLII